MREVLTQQELAERWGVTVKTITEYRNEGIISPIKKIPAIRFALKDIQEIEGHRHEKFTLLDKKNLEKEMNELREENKRLKTVLSNILSESSKVIEFIN